MYNRYSKTEKDDLLICAKEKRKAFIQQIAVKLKPFGFKKKANIWTCALENEYCWMEKNLWEVKKGGDTYEKESHCRRAYLS